MERDELLSYLVGEIIGRKKVSRPHRRLALMAAALQGNPHSQMNWHHAFERWTYKCCAHPWMVFITREMRRYQKGEYLALGYYEDAYDYRLVIDCVLGPLSGNLFPVLCRQIAHDVRTDMLDSSPPIPVGRRSILLFEGLFLFRRELNALCGISEFSLKSTPQRPCRARFIGMQMRQIWRI